MLQVDTDNIAVLNLITYGKDGVPHAADGLPTITVYNTETDAVLVSASAVLVDTDYPGEYTYELSSIHTSSEKVLRLLWRYSVHGLLVTNTEYLYVVNPYVTVDETILELGYSSRIEDPNYFPFEKIVSAERTARMMINEYLGFSIGKKEGTIVCYGTGSDILPLYSKVVDVVKLTENDQLVIDHETGYNIFGNDIEVTETGYGVRIIPSNPGDNIDEQEIIDVFGNSKGKFREGYRYEVYGIIGWNYIPLEIKQAAFLLINDLLCSDSSWRTKYIKKINNGQMSVEISGLTYHGTGNAIADSILNKFRMIQAVII